ncbi:phosphate ABC transporter ATP-binding protein [Patescibacteria group bacterium]|nr:phosphate ABC transporter ATP-binding protein [Patescibacteria group bacterium]
MKNNYTLEVKNLQVWYEDQQVLKQISVKIPKGKITALIGASGSGKSTFLRSLNRILETNPVVKIDGLVKIGGQKIYEPTTDLIELRRKVGMVFQSPTPFPKSIYENVAFGLKVAGVKPNQSKKPWWQIFEQKRTANEIENSEDFMDKVVVNSLKEAALWKEVKDRLHTSALKLSGGQQQRLCIARAIAVQPEILLLDEPCSALDPISTKKIEELLLKLSDKYTIVIVTHNLHQAKRISDHIGFFHLGEMIEFGESQYIFEKPEQKLTKEYVGGHFG